VSNDIIHGVDGWQDIETYESDLGTVFYDADNPVAWIECSVVLEVGKCA